MTRTAIKNQAAKAVEAAKPPTLRWTIWLKKRKGNGGSKRASVRVGVDSRVQQVHTPFRPASEAILVLQSHNKRGERVLGSCKRSTR
jgi:hypothetical protein